jgi:hypothetical protein
VTEPANLGSHLTELRKRDLERRVPGFGKGVPSCPTFWPHSFFRVGQSRENLVGSVDTPGGTSYKFTLRGTTQGTYGLVSLSPHQVWFCCWSATVDKKGMAYEQAS